MNWKKKEGGWRNGLVYIISGAKWKTGVEVRYSTDMLWFSGDAGGGRQINGVERVWEEKEWST